MLQEEHVVTSSVRRCMLLLHQTLQDQEKPLGSGYSVTLRISLQTHFASLVVLLSLIRKANFLLRLHKRNTTKRCLKLISFPRSETFGVC